MPIYEYQCRNCQKSLEKITRKVPEGGPALTLSGDDLDCSGSCTDSCAEKSCNCSNGSSKCIFDLVPSTHSKHSSWKNWNFNL